MKSSSTTWHFVSLPVMDYRTVLAMQHRLVSEKISGRLKAGVVLWVEHWPVFTRGRHSRIENLKVPVSFLAQKGIPVVPVERGGDITFHGPGQLVAYPIFQPEQEGLRIPDYIHRLEEVMIRTAGDFSVAATRTAKNPGVWAGGKKLGSVGIALRHGVCFHGLALNYHPDLAPFHWIDPCGLPDVEMTSIAACTRFPVTRGQVGASARKYFSGLFKIDPIRVPLSDLEKEFRAA